MADNPANDDEKETSERRKYEHEDSCSCRFNPSGTNYYVSVIDGPRFGLLAGPFPTHVESLEWVERAKEEAHRVDPWSVFYAFGTTAMRPEYRKPGSLNDLLRLDHRVTRSDGGA